MRNVGRFFGVLFVIHSYWCSAGAAITMTVAVDKECFRPEAAWGRELKVLVFETGKLKPTLTSKTIFKKSQLNYNNTPEVSIPIEIDLATATAVRASVVDTDGKKLLAECSIEFNRDTDLGKNYEVSGMSRDYTFPMGWSYKWDEKATETDPSTVVPESPMGERCLKALRISVR